jgi:hypothetical protein
MITRNRRTGFFVLIATMLIAGSCGDAFAKTGKVRDRNQALNAYAAEPVKSTGLAPMRYYGGPKSPMWRGPAQN